MSRREERSK
jgi:hypothetical protein